MQPACGRLVLGDPAMRPSAGEGRVVTAAWSPWLQVRESRVVNATAAVECPYVCNLAEEIERRLQRVSVIDSATATVLECSISGGWHAALRVHCRRASDSEVRRQRAATELVFAARGECFDTLHACLVKARARGVEVARLDAAAAKLKTLRPVGATAEELRGALGWAAITRHESDHAGPIVCRCGADGCAVGPELPGAVMTVESGFLEGAFAGDKEIMKQLRSCAPDAPRRGADRWLFERIAEAATLSAADGAVWRAGGKLIFSATTRNQSPVALDRYLSSLGQRDCAAGMRALVAHVEKVYDKSVSAVQINIHLDSSSYHAQHRDIYGLEQRDNAGRDCTCSFKPNVATACLSLGSSRRCLCKSEHDAMSEHTACGEHCVGYSSSAFLHSG